MQQFVSLATRKQNEHSSNEGQRGEKGKTAKRRTAQYSSSQQPSSDNEISLHRPTLAAKISNQCETIQGIYLNLVCDLPCCSFVGLSSQNTIQVFGVKWNWTAVIWKQIPISSIFFKICFFLS